MEDGNEIEIIFTDAKTGYTVVFHDDGRVAYGYMHDPDGGSIIADIWLYNRCETPREPEWRDREMLPFANPMEYSKDHGEFIPVNDVSEVTVEWAPQDQGRMRAIIYIRGDVFGIMEDGTKPGWARMAAKDGPLAKVLRNSEIE